MSGPVITTVVGNIGAGPASIQDTFSGGSDPIVVITIAAVPQRNSLAAFSWVYAATLDGDPVVPDSQTWSFTGDGAGSLNNANAVSPLFTPTVPGLIHRQLTIVVDGISYISSISTVQIGDGTGVVATISGVPSSQKSLSPITPTVAATKGGISVTAITNWSWYVNGSTSGFVNNSISAPSYVPIISGDKTFSCIITINNVNYVSSPFVCAVLSNSLIASASFPGVIENSFLTADGTAT